MRETAQLDLNVGVKNPNDVKRLEVADGVKKELLRLLTHDPSDLEKFNNFPEVTILANKRANPKPKPKPKPKP